MFARAASANPEPDTDPVLPGLGRAAGGGGTGAAPEEAPPDWNAPPIFLRNDPILEIFIAPIAMAGPGAVSKPPVCGALVFLVVLVLFE
jgi:hypothetical protein